VRSRAAWTAAAATVVAAAAAIGGAVIWKGDAAPAGAAAAASVQTTTVTRTRLSTGMTLSGTLGYAAAQPLSGHKPGIVTWLPPSGETVTRGQRIYTVDNEPVPLCYGTTPLYRELNAAGMVGPDVKTVARNLSALGYDIGYQPPVGSVVTQARPIASPRASPLTVTAHAVRTASPQPTPSPTLSPTTVPTAVPPSSSRSPSPAPSRATGQPSVTPPASHGAPSGSPVAKPSATGGTGATPAKSRTPASKPPVVTATVRQGDAVLTRTLIRAIARWQAAEGLPATGILGVGDILVEPGPVLVTSVQAQLGDPAQSQLMTVALTAKTITVPVDSADIVSVRRSGKVTITLPDGSTTSGTIIAVGTSVQSGQSTTDGQPQQAVTIAPDDRSAVAGLTSAPVQVTFAGETATGVLAVPVTALLALSGGGYALQLPDGRLIRVQTGLFAQGMVQVSGPEIRTGLRVVTSG
jgi:hypothetical protein